MHDGCQGQAGDGAKVVDKLRMMGFSNYSLPQEAELICSGCDQNFTMATLECRCPHCGMVYGVTPCHAHDTKSIQAAGIDY